jgi:hypothetical protein
MFRIDILQGKPVQAETAILRHFLAHIILMFLLSLPVNGQLADFYIGFDGIGDNRELTTPYVKSQTIFGARINPGVSFGFDSYHSVNLGINYMYEFGGELLGIMPQLDLYYSYKSEQFNFLVGSFPRKDLLDYPLLVLTDTLNYYRPNMEGASVSYAWGWGDVHAWIDWTGRISNETREGYMAGFDATFRAGIFYLTTLTTGHHLARISTWDPSNTLWDDGSVLGIIGTDLSEKLVLDKLNISTAWVSTYARLRGSDAVWTKGWLTQLDARYGIFGIEGTCYLGESPHLLYGDWLYRSGNYGRIDLFIDPFNNPRISSKIGVSMHLISGEGLQWSQQLLISVML